MKSIVSDSEPELTTNEVAELLRCDPATIRLYYREGMPGRRVSYRKILFRLSVCNRWLEAREAAKEKERQKRAKEREAAK